MTAESRLRLVGFFKSAEEVTDLASSAEHAWEPLAIDYLQRGTIVVVAMQSAEDLVNPDNKNIGQFSLRTDGSWVWPSALAHYVKTYHVSLPEEFLSHMASRDWELEELDEASLKAVGKQLRGQLA